MNSFDIADHLTQRGFRLVTDPDRTKAHGYHHDSLGQPVYVKVVGPKGALRPASAYPLVLHPRAAERLSLTAVPPGVSFASGSYHSTGLRDFPPNGKGTPSGRACQVDGPQALDRLIAALGVA